MSNTSGNNTKGFREVERKFVVADTTMKVSELNKLISEAFHVEGKLVGESADLYWYPPERSKAQFIRLRLYKNGNSELTVKAQDRGNNVDRIEINNDMPEREAALAYLNLLHGEPCLKLTKAYTVFWISKALNISTYIVSGDLSRIYVEVEGANLEEIDPIVAQIEKFVELRTETRSLFNIYSKERVSLFQVLMGFKHA